MKRVLKRSVVVLLLLMGLWTLVQAQDQKAPAFKGFKAKFVEAPKALSKDAKSSDWKSFLGPSHDAVSTETKILKSFPKTGPKLVWSLKKDQGYSAPAIAGELAVLFHRLKGEAQVLAVERETGKRVWSFEYPSRYKDRYGYSNGTRSSPVIHKGKVYVYGMASKLHCLNLKDGALIWKKDLRALYKLKQEFFGTATTPLVEGKALIINVGAPNLSANVVAFDLDSGKELWKCGDSYGGSYASPVPATIHGRRVVFVFGGGEGRPPYGGLVLVDVKKGEVLDRFKWRSKSYESVNAACPVVVGDEVLITASYKTGAAKLKVTKDFKLQKVWLNKNFGCHFGTPIHRDGYVYGFDGRHMRGAQLVCLDWRTGKEQWRTMLSWQESLGSGRNKRVLTLSPGRASLLWVEGHVLCQSETGHLLWLSMNKEGVKILARHRVFAAPEAWTGPVLSHGLLYISQNQPGREDADYPRWSCFDLRGS